MAFLPAEFCFSDGSSSLYLSRYPEEICLSGASGLLTILKSVTNSFFELISASCTYLLLLKNAYLTSTFLT
jgi:hypothetical protein